MLELGVVPIRFREKIEIQQFLPTICQEAAKGLIL